VLFCFLSIVLANRDGPAFVLAQGPRKPIL